MSIGLTSAIADGANRCKASRVLTKDSAAKQVCLMAMYRNFGREGHVSHIKPSKAWQYDISTTSRISRKAKRIDRRSESVSALHPAILRWEMRLVACNVGNSRRKAMSTDVSEISKTFSLVSEGRDCNMVLRAVADKVRQPDKDNTSKCLQAERGFHCPRFDSAGPDNGHPRKSKCFKVFGRNGRELKSGQDANTRWVNGGPETGP
mmetsp:Transcript_27406/g.41441  ORF Transcript_27406/g.41441 Transcript_27406/m.41441 type:complete len:206 (+) Transcript_27406:425-1042(+)